MNRIYLLKTKSALFLGLRIESEETLPSKVGSIQFEFHAEAHNHLFSLGFIDNLFTREIQINSLSCLEIGAVFATPRFPVILLVIGAFATQSAFGEDASVSGEFKGNGKEAKLAFITAHKGEPFADKPTTVLVMTEKDHSKDRNPATSANFGKFGSALIITFHPDGKIVGCQVVHSAHKKSGFSSIGDLKSSNFKIEDGMIRGKLSTGGEVTTFGDKWEINLEFRAKAP